MASARLLRVAVLSGGRSSEREISLLTGRGVLAALGDPDPQGADPGQSLGTIGAIQTLDARIEADGRWSLDTAPPVTSVEALSRLAGVDLVFLALHGGAGEDGTLQGLLETHGLRYTGSGVRASALCMDKHALRLVAAEAGLAVPPGCSVSGRAWASDRPAVLDRLASLGQLDHEHEGWFVKPRCGGSSVATSAVRKATDLAAAVELTLATGDDALVETWVPGVEVSCGVLGDHDGALEVLMPVEIQTSGGSFFDYEQKYDDQHGARELCPPPSLDDDARRTVRADAERAHRAAGCLGYSRVDFICPPSNARPVLLEINTLPGLTPRSLLPREAAHAGLSYRGLVLSIIERALAREPRP